MLRSLLASSGDCIKILDLDGKLIFMTEGGQRIMEVSDFSLIEGCPWPDFWQDQGNVEAKAAIETAKAGKIAHFNGFATTMKGTGKWWDVTVSPIFDENGKVEKLLSVSRDVTAEHEARTAIKASEARFQKFAQVMPNQVWSATADGQLDWFNDVVFDYSGLRFEELRGTGWAQMVHPDDIGDAAEKWAAALAGGKPYQTEFRLRQSDGVWRWHLARAMPIRNSGGEVDRWVGTNTDIEEHKAAQEEQRLLSLELDHRMKNMLAIVSAISHQSFRGSETKEEAQTIFNARLKALAVAHDALQATSWVSASMTHVVQAALQPHRTGEGSIRTTGPEIILTSKQALSLALTLHELATNAAKYGSLSAASGKVDLTWQAGNGGNAVSGFAWRESGGPTVIAPTRKGFGTLLIERTLAADFGGKVVIDYTPSGLVCQLQPK